MSCCAAHGGSTPSRAGAWVVPAAAPRRAGGSRRHALAVENANLAPQYASFAWVSTRHGGPGARQRRQRGVHGARCRTRQRRRPPVGAAVAPRRSRTRPLAGTWAGDAWKSTCISTYAFERHREERRGSSSWRAELPAMLVACGTRGERADAAGRVGWGEAQLVYGVSRRALHNMPHARCRSRRRTGRCVRGADALLPRALANGGRRTRRRRPP
mmetsp:Transcript_17382/g.61146  ORF Transcript_17382/g.61146 Transcript_17382/m.61146 type:complete len:214 (+) Transcript_17382:86-727(+)